MRYLVVKNFEKYQHYSNRPTNPWIKVHKKLLDDRTFMSLADDSKWLAIALWLLASETNNCIPYSPDDLSWRLRMTSSEEFERLLQPLLANDFIELSSDCLEEKREEERR